MTQNRAELILALRDEISSGMAKVNASLAQTRQAVADLGASGKKAAEQHASAWASATAQAGKYAKELMAVAGVTLSVAGAAYLAKQAYSEWVSIISGGISAVDDYKTSIISAAAMLTSMTDPQSEPDLGAAYGEWKNYFAWLWDAAIEADKKVAASQREIYETAKELAKKNVRATTQEQVEAIGRLTDFIRSVSPMMAGEGVRNVTQIKSEIEALMTGQTRLTAQTAYNLQQLDPAFKTNIKRAREMGTALEYLDGLIKGQKYATEDMANTWNSVSASLRSTWQQIQIRAFGGAYTDVVKYGQTLMSTLIEGGNLTERGEKLAEALGEAWGRAKTKVAALLDYLTGNSPEAIRQVETLAGAVGTIGGAAATAVVKVANLITKLQEMANNPHFKTILAAAAGGAALSGFGPAGVGVGVTLGIIGGAIDQTRQATDAAGKAEQKLLEKSQEQLGVQKKITASQHEAVTAKLKELGATEANIKKLREVGKEAPKTPKTKDFQDPNTGGTGGGKGQAGSSLNAMQSLLDRLNTEIARLSEGGMGEVDAWYKKTVHDINKLVVAGADGADALVLAERAAGLKKQKINDEFYQYMAKASGNAYVAIEAESNKWLQKVGGDITQVMQLWELKGRQEWEADVKVYTNRLSLDKSFYDQAANLAGNHTDQVNLRREALNREIEVQKYQLAVQLNQLEVAGKITAEERDRYLANQALLSQQKRYNFEMENNKGLAGWAWERGKEADQRNTVKEMLRGVESGFQSAFSSGLQGVLTQDKTTLKKISQTLWTSGIGDIHKGSITRLFETGAKLGRSLLSPGQVAGTQGAAGSTGNYAGQLSQAAQGLKQAGGKFGVNAAQFGLAAGGLLLSGVGIATNSQALVIAGTVLQLAGLAIQIYQALTAATTTIAMTGAALALTGSAAALTGAAGMLMVAATVDAIPFFHTGGAIMHWGGPILPVYAHAGLNLKDDERLIIGQLGEGVLSRRGMAGLSQGWFDDLNRGNYDVVGPALIRRRWGADAPWPAESPSGYGGGGAAPPAPRPRLNLHLQLPSGETIREDDIWRTTQKGINKGKIRIERRR